MRKGRLNRRQFMGFAAGVGIFALADPGGTYAGRRAAGALPQEERPIIVRGGSVDLEFDENTYRGSNGKYTGSRRQINRVTYTLPNGNEQDCAGTGPVTIRCTNPQTTITIRNSGQDVAIEFDEGTFQGTQGSGQRGNANARLLDMRNGTTACWSGRVTELKIYAR